SFPFPHGLLPVQTAPAPGTHRQVPYSSVNSVSCIPSGAWTLALWSPHGVTTGGATRTAPATTSRSAMSSLLEIGRASCRERVEFRRVLFRSLLSVPTWPATGADCACAGDSSPGALLQREQRQLHPVRCLDPRVMVAPRCHDRRCDPDGAGHDEPFCNVLTV